MNESAHHAANGGLHDDLHDVITAVETLLRDSASEAGAEFREARAALDARLQAAKAAVAERAHRAAGRAQEMEADADRFVRTNPWLAVGIGAGAGVLLGMLLRRRGRS